jgi:hypothetical protein
LDPGHRRRVRRAVATQDQQPGAGVGRPQARRDVRGKARQVLDQALPVLYPRVRIRGPARLVGGITVVAERRPGQARTGGQSVHQAVRP